MGTVFALVDLEDGHDDEARPQIQQPFLPVDECWREEVVVDQEDHEERHILFPHHQDLVPLEGHVGVRVADQNTHHWCQEQQGPQRQIDDGFLLMFSFE